MRAAVHAVVPPPELVTEEPSASGEYLKPLTRATLPQEIVAAIADLIMTGVWKPGDRIPSEKELAARFGVGRSTIREAIKSLVILGVIDARPGDGSFIREGTSDLLSGAFEWGLMLTEQNLGDLVDMRILIEVECAGRAAAAGDPEAGATLLQLIERMKEARNHPEQFMRLDNQFHETMSVTRDMSGFRSTRSVRFVPEGSHAAGGQNCPDHRCDWVASSEEVELRRGGGAVGDERAALSPAARCL